MESKASWKKLGLASYIHGIGDLVGKLSLEELEQFKKTFNESFVKSINRNLDTIIELLEVNKK